MLNSKKWWWGKHLFTEWHSITVVSNTNKYCQQWKITPTMKRKLSLEKHNKITQKYEIATIWKIVFILTKWRGNSACSSVYKIKIIIQSCWDYYWIKTWFFCHNEGII